MVFYRRILPVVNALCPWLLSTQAANLSLLIGAILMKRTLCLTKLATAFPIPAERRVYSPKHELLYRLKRLSRFLGNHRVDPVAVQVAFIPAILSRLGHPRTLGLIVDWTSFDVTLPKMAKLSGRRKYQVLTIGVPHRGRTIPLLSVVYERDKMPERGSQNRWEEQALTQVLAALPQGVRPVVIGDRAFGRAEFIRWLQGRRVDYVLRVRRGTIITAGDGRQWKLGKEGLKQGEVRWVTNVRYATYHDRPRDLWVNLACSWRSPKRRRADKKGKEYQEPWYLVTSLGNLGWAVAWYRQRMWIEENFKDFHSTFGLDDAQVGSAQRFAPLVAALSLAVAWLHLLTLSRVGVLPKGWGASVVTFGRASVVSLALAFIDYFRDLPPKVFPLPKSVPKAA